MLEDAEVDLRGGGSGFLGNTDCLWAWQHGLPCPPNSSWTSACGAGGAEACISPPGSAKAVGGGGGGYTRRVLRLSLPRANLV